MVSLRKIKLEGFRGARLPVEMDFTNRHASVAIYGDNGGGNGTQEFNDYLEQSKKERLFLRYGDVLRFVLLTKGEKRTQILDIIGYRHVSDIRSTLVSACNSLERNSKFRSVRDQIEKNNAHLMEKTGKTK